MTRRTFAAAALAAAPAIPGPRPGASTKITSITVAPMQERFHKFVTMNSQDKVPKGHTYEGTLIRIRTSNGAEGVGTGTYDRPDAALLAALKKLIGSDPAQLYTWTGERITDRAASHADVLSKYRHLDGPLFDLIGKLQGKPCWKLMGDAARDKVEVYDGTLYISDVWFRDRGVKAVVEEAEEAAKSGFLGMKLKIGRGWHWMDKEPGLLRDIEVINAVRKAVGPNIKVLADANNGYQGDPERAWRLMAGTMESKLYWIEEIFREDVAAYTSFREKLKGRGSQTLIADGESVRNVEDFQPYLSPKRLMDVLQMDIRRGGFVDNMKMARMAEAAGGYAVPHNWGSQIGDLMGLHFSKATKCAFAAEDDRSTCDVLNVEGYSFQKGLYAVTDRPGLGISVNQSVYEQKCKSGETVVA